MSTLLDQIRKINFQAAHELKDAGYETDSDIRSLDRQDLYELLPGKDKLRVRKKIYEFICGLHQQSHKKSIETMLEEIKRLFPSGCSDAEALIDNGPLLEYLQILNTFTRSLIDLLEKNKARPAVEPSGDVCMSSTDSAPVSETSADEYKVARIGRYFGRNILSYLSQGRQDSTTPTTSASANYVRPCPLKGLIKATVMYKMVVSGKTMDTHVDVMQWLNGPVPGRSEHLQLKETQRDEESQVTIVFCPIVSRAETDVDAALQRISRDKPVIVVAMHHLHTPTAQLPPRANFILELGVNVFFYETKGLLNCPENDAAIDEMKSKLYEISTKKKFCK